MSDPRPSQPPPREGLLPQQPVRWGLPDAILGLAVFIGLVLGGNLLGRAPWYPRSDPLGLALNVVFYAILVAVLVVIARRRGLGSLVRDFGLSLKWVDLLIGIALAVVYHFAGIYLYEFAVGVLRLPAAPTGNLMLPRSFVTAVIYGLGIAGFLAPLVEELYFRGLIMRAIRNRVVRSAKFEGPKTTRRASTISIWASAIIFAVCHLWEATNLTMLFVLGFSILIFGLMAAAIATRTRRLGPSLIAHISTNTFGVLVLLSSHPR